ncbi:hypothetical protein [Rhodococcus pyridinivorans]|uniref:hypothetical protein n=1 Tax=Rhodococcus pyridinivorans TaxID=103816 RepID=UPI0039B5F2B7
MDDTLPQQVERGGPVHLPLEHFDSVHVPFDWASRWFFASKAGTQTEGMGAGGPSGTVDLNG